MRRPARSSILMISREKALRLANDWVEAWNRHDLDRMLTLCDDDCELTTPYIVTLMNEPSGALRGKDKIRACWTRALERVPDLRLDLVQVLVGVESVTLYCRTVFGRLAAEVLYVDRRGKVVRTVVHYSEM